MFHKPSDKEVSCWFTHGVKILNPGIQSLLDLSALLGCVRVRVNVAVVTRRQDSRQRRSHQNYKKLCRKLELNLIHRLSIFPPNQNKSSPLGEKGADASSRTC